MEPWRIVTLQNNRSKAGLLVIAEVVKATGGLFGCAPRAYFIVNDTPAHDLRGGHYHPPGGKQEILICLTGSVEVELHSAVSCGRIALDHPELGLIVPSGTWHEVRMAPGSVLAAVASTLYSPSESVRERLACVCRP